MSLIVNRNTNLNRQEIVNASQKNPSQKEYYDYLIEHMNFEEDRRKDLEVLEEHPTQKITITNNENEIEIEVDTEMIPFIKWMNSLEGTCTHYCCQGDVYKPTQQGKNFHNQPYVSWTSDNIHTVSRIIRLFDDFHNNKHKTNSYCHIQTEVEWYEGKLRYITRWFDNLVYRDFIEWAGIV